MGEINLIQFYEYNIISNLLLIVNGLYQFTFIRKKKYTFSIIYKSIETSHDLEDTSGKRSLKQHHNLIEKKNQFRWMK